MSSLALTLNEAVHVDLRRIITSCHPQTQLQDQMPYLKQLKSLCLYTYLRLLTCIYLTEYAVSLTPLTTICPVGEGNIFLIQSRNFLMCGIRQSVTFSATATH